jgi:hypothetical protein
MSDLGENLKSLKISSPSLSSSKKREERKKLFDCFSCNLQWEDREKNNVIFY